MLESLKTSLIPTSLLQRRYYYPSMSLPLFISDKETNEQLSNLWKISQLTHDSRLKTRPFIV